MQRRVLLVDDEPEIVRVAAEYLTALGWDPKVATTLAEAERIAELRIPLQAAVVDWVIEGSSARRLIERLGTYQPQCPILLTTGHGSELLSEAVMGLPMIRKPYSMKTLSLRLEALAEGRR
jgi:DNA-binding response OmpR family regulator